MASGNQNSLFFSFINSGFGGKCIPVDASYPQSTKIFFYQRTIFAKFHKNHSVVTNQPVDKHVNNLYIS